MNDAKTKAPGIRRVLLIDPPWVVEDIKNLWHSVRSCLPSLGLAYVAAVLEQEGCIVKMIDCTAERISVESFPKKLAKMQIPPDFIGITATTPIFPNAVRIACTCRKLFPNAKVIFGGVHPTVMPDEVLSYEFIDYVVRDEGEETVKELVCGKLPAEILGLSYRAGKKVIHNAQRPLIRDINILPFPAYHLLPMKKYMPAVGSYKNLPAMSLFATRGCPGRCTFCHRAFRGIVRARSARNILDEIKLLQKGYGIREILFYDDTFTLFSKVINEFCNLVIREGVKFSWSCFTRVDCVNREMLANMKQAGCHTILIGVESGNEEILKNINKKINLNQVRAFVRMAREAGIETRASFMLGNPGETVNTMKETIQFAIDLDPDEVQFNITTVYPGTEMYEWAKSKGYIKTKDWSRYNVSDVVLELPTVDSRTVKQYYSTAHRKFYLRPRVIARRLLKIRNLTQLVQEVRGALVVVRS